MKPSQTCIGSAVPWASWNRLGKPPAPSTQRSPFPAPRPLQGPGGPPFSAQRTVSGLFAALEGRVRALPEVKGPVTVGRSQAGSTARWRVHVCWEPRRRPVGEGMCDALGGREASCRQGGPCSKAEGGGGL